MVRGYGRGSLKGFWQPSVFTRTRASAEHIKQKLLGGEDIEYADYFFPDSPPTRPTTSYTITAG